ncbi:hypothetical protein Pure05_03970 [Paenarthrobacter ureafaciens]|nr:hypothetical protein ARZXY2_939 [Arthrobacter sp. ZXY-2]BCW84974.1 hypothetical protein NicSoilE8_26470 [Arthrobacter sp. NicSoilE8]GLU57535.1 hypothetical protein Pure01_00480 [Paenarthrobacter ureafaciens]GLU62149.1 hypothetical protein Pure02_03990 [Paenarthrobacter ureafaciens]GLU66423.1 hypothetical protein Pure03_03990 [Paenarthrobacter ureafaciens]
MLQQRSSRVRHPDSPALKPRSAVGVLPAGRDAKSWHRLSLKGRGAQLERCAAYFGRTC